MTLLLVVACRCSLLHLATFQTPRAVTSKYLKHHKYLFVERLVWREFFCSVSTTFLWPTIVVAPGTTSVICTGVCRYPGQVITHVRGYVINCCLGAAAGTQDTTLPAERQASGNTNIEKKPKVKISTVCKPLGSSCCSRSNR